MDLPHRGRGLCKACYGTDNVRRHKMHISRTTHRLGAVPLNDLSRQSPYLGVPSPYTRTRLSELLEISPRQVGRIMHSAEIMRGIENLSRIADTTGDTFRYSLRELKSQVDKLMGISKTSVGIINGRILFDELRCGYVDEQISYLFPSSACYSDNSFLSCSERNEHPECPEFSNRPTECTKMIRKVYYRSGLRLRSIVTSHCSPAQKRSR